MAIEFEIHSLTGPISSLVFTLKHTPLTGPMGDNLVLVDALHATAQREGIDWEITGGSISYDLPNSSIKKIRQHDIDNFGESSIGPVVQVIYEY